MRNQSHTCMLPSNLMGFDYFAQNTIDGLKYVVVAAMKTSKNNIQKQETIKNYSQLNPQEQYYQNRDNKLKQVSDRTSNKAVINFFADVKDFIALDIMLPDSDALVSVPDKLKRNIIKINKHNLYKLIPDEFSRAALEQIYKSQSSDQNEITLFDYFSCNQDKGASRKPHINNLLQQQQILQQQQQPMNHPYGNFGRAPESREIVTIVIQNGEDYKVIPERMVRPESFSDLNQWIQNNYKFDNPVVCSKTLDIISDFQAIKPDETILVFDTKQNVEYNRAGFRIIPIAADKDCLFNSIKHHVQKASRKAIVDHMTEQLAKYLDTKIEDAIKQENKSGPNEVDSPLFMMMMDMTPQQDTVGTYLKRMAVSGWGGCSEIAAAADLYKANIKVYTNGKIQQDCFPEHIKKIPLHYNGSNHYDALELISNVGNQQNKLGGGANETSDIEALQKKNELLQQQLDLQNKLGGISQSGRSQEQTPEQKQAYQELRDLDETGLAKWLRDRRLNEKAITALFNQDFNGEALASVEKDTLEKLINVGPVSVIARIFRRELGLELK
ncbi:hypothetical protein AKO1_000933 [Acrasis kona]|uniref:Ubiquitin thioesterase OTU n=1 Tax=Acrasis kona TaxID=1008807 RepID=A0AAW2ZRI8_9EUKA